MKAYRFEEWQTEPRLQEVREPQPNAGEVLIKVAASGACHSDLHVMEWPAGQLPWKLPFTLGHEVTGRVVEIGPGVKGLETGEAVAVYGPWGCGRCRNCRLGMENYCEHQAEIPASGGGLGLDGGMAEYMLIPSPRFLVPLGGLDPVAAAPLCDAALTPYHAIKRSLGLLRPGSTAVVIGAGGLGHMAIQILAALTPSRIVAVDVARDKLTLAEEVGATDMVISDEDAAQRIRGLTHDLGAELVLDFVGSDATMALGAKTVRSLGDMTIIGLAGGGLGFNFFTLPYEASLAATYWGSVTELMEVIDLATAGKIAARIERFPLEKIHEAYEKLRAGAIDGRAVIVPG